MQAGGAAKIAEMVFVLPEFAAQRGAMLARFATVRPAFLAEVIAVVARQEVGAGEGADELQGLVKAYMDMSFKPDAVAEACSHAASVLVALIDSSSSSAEQGEQFAGRLAATESGSLMKSVLATPRIASSFGNRHVALIAKARAAQLTYPKPALSFAQGNAHVPRHPTVTAFLQSERREMTYDAPFTDSTHAYNFARKHFWGGFNRAEQHRATATVTDENTVVITKGGGANARMKAYEADQVELQALQPLLAGGDEGQSGSDLVEMIEDGKVVVCLE